MLVAVPEGPFAGALAGLPGVEVHAGSTPRSVEFCVLPARPDPASLAELAHRPRLRVVQAVTAAGGGGVGGLPAGVTLCNAAGVFDDATAEWVLTAVLASLRGLPGFVRCQAAGEWAYRQTDGLDGRTVLIVGFG